MAAAMVDRATSSMLIGPDWAMNAEICQILNRDPGQTKDVLKGIKRRLHSKKPKVQLLALSLLESIVQSCGDIVHMYIAERDILSDMVKLVRKKPDFHVKEKILVLIDTWQEAFGGPRARYPQYYAAYQELLHAGAVFPQRSDRPAFTPNSRPTNGAPSYTQSQQGYKPEAPESSGTNLPVLTLAEVLNARGTMDVLSEMLNAVDPSNREGLKQDVLVDLVEQCRANRRKIIQLVNTTSDEGLLSEGLSLNDDLQRVLAKHDAIAAGIPIGEEKPKTSSALVDVGDNKAQDTQASNVISSTTGQSSFNQLLLTGPPSSDQKVDRAGAANVKPLVDLLSWDDVSAPTNEDALAVVPITAPSTTTASSEQKALVLYDMFGESSNTTNANPPPQAFANPSEHQIPPPTFVPDGNIPDMGLVSNEQANYTQGSLPISANPMWNNQPIPNIDVHQQEQPINSDMNDPPGGAFPLPPWEAQPSQDAYLGAQQPQLSQGVQPGGMHSQVMPNFQAPQMMQNPQDYSQVVQGAQPPLSLPIQSGQFPGMYPYPMQGMSTGMNFQHPSGQMGGMQFQQPTIVSGMQSMPPMQGSQMGAYYAYSQQQELQYFNQGAGYALPNQNDLSQRMYGLSMQGNNGWRSTVPSSNTSSLSQPMRAPKQEDKFFGDLVDIAKSKQNKSTL